MDLIKDFYVKLSIVYLLYIILWINFFGWDYEVKMAPHPMKADHFEKYIYYHASGRPVHLK